jgi:hypothetical protein
VLRRFFPRRCPPKSEMRAADYRLPLGTGGTGSLAVEHLKKASKIIFHDLLEAIGFENVAHIGECAPTSLDHFLVHLYNLKFRFPKSI